ncbi:MAG: rhomboid family intramembrane serine protease [Euryarchaeota archaeon]|nr:rhomboid family intramembrane serine protease [Euryarchaeota archaeon]
MDIVMLPIHLVSLVAICIMVGAIVIAYVKKLMITYAIIIANLIIFALTFIFENEIIGDLGFRPIYLSAQYFPNVYTLFTSMFVHSGFLHIFGNMLVFFFMGIAFEQRIGSKKFLIIYLITGVCGALTHSLLNLSYPNNQIILIGASGAIFGIMGAFAYSYPRDEVVMPVPIGIMFIMRIKVIYATIIFAALETFVVMLEVQDNTAHFAHLGGLISGAVLAALLIKTRAEKENPQETMHYNSYIQQKSKKINFANLEKLAEAKEQKEMLKRIESETVPQVREIWLDHFLEKTKCPKCGKALNSFEGKIWCKDCDFKTDY